jgi:bifunctional DNA-binding transcriptional regulator/antitoxin component of YhaV-PrlF toxin-antitoxin module
VARTAEQACKAQALHGLSLGLLPLPRGVMTAGLRFEAEHGNVSPMTATFTIDDAGQINLPDALKRVFGVEPGVRLRAEVTSDRIEIVKDIPVVTETIRSSSGRLVLAPTGIKMDAGKAIREERDALANRALRK